MIDTKESFHESLIIKRAKRRLIGAITILIILFTLSLFFIKNTSEINNSEIKVSFLEMGQASFSGLKKPEKLQTNKTNPIKLSNKTNLEDLENDNTKLFTIQIGIFSDEKKIEKLSRQINNIGFQTQIKKINLSGKEKIKLTTQDFVSEKEAQIALRKLKNANFPGLIKQINL
tara:strand:+ start:122 stop:640 length:519 start_codon:yes stop_codon:yes gene_type:complete